jgi:hypothetical protein
MTLVANLGVVAGIVFLAIEIQQNTNMMQAQTRSAITQNTVTLFLSMDLEGAENYTSGSAGELRTGTPEWFLFQSKVQAALRTYENEFFQYEHGLFGEELLQTRLNTWSSVLRPPAVQNIWQHVKRGYSPAFVQIVDQLIQGNGRETNDWVEPSTD